MHGLLSQVGDLSTEIDARVKDRVAELRGKESYELGDLTLALDELAKEEVLQCLPCHPLLPRPCATLP